MPDWKTHLTGVLVLAPAHAISLWALSGHSVHPLYLAQCTAGFVGEALFFSPDLDVITRGGYTIWDQPKLGTKGSKIAPLKPVKWGWLVYQLIPHRSFWSHGPFVGAFVRYFIWAATVAFALIVGRFLVNDLAVNLGWREQPLIGHPLWTLSNQTMLRYLFVWPWQQDWWWRVFGLGVIPADILHLVQDYWDTQRRK